MTKLQLLIDFISENSNEIFFHAIQCDTEEKAEDLISLLYSLGFRWEEDAHTNSHFEQDGSVMTKWSEKGRTTCYSLTLDKIILFGKKSFYENQGKKIITYEELFNDAEDFSSEVNTDDLKKDFKPEKSVSKIISDTQSLTESVKIQLESKTCPQCGSTILNDGTKFCMECGFKIPEDFFLTEIMPSSDEDISGNDIKEDANTNTHDKNHKQEKSIKSIKTFDTTKKQLISLSAIILFVTFFTIVIQIIQKTSPNHFSQFSTVWETVHIISYKFGGLL